MGYMRHHAILVSSSWDRAAVAKAHAEASTIFPHVSPILPHIVNGGASFFVPPDGSKEGWSDSDAGDDRRGRFIEWLNTRRFEDNSSCLDWAEVFYGDDNGDAAIVRHDGEVPVIES